MYVIWIRGRTKDPELALESGVLTTATFSHAVVFGIYVTVVSIVLWFPFSSFFSKQN